MSREISQDSEIIVCPSGDKDSSLDEFSVLFHPSIELGLELCEYNGKTSRSNKFQSLIHSLCLRYITGLSNLMVRVLDFETLAKVNKYKMNHD
jgi:hypothetical protein